MARRTSRFLILGLGVAGAMIFLIVVGMRGPNGLVYYRTVAEFREKGPPPGGHWRVNGTVETGSIDRGVTGEQVRFTITDGKATMPVDYRGIIPDTFVDGADVVIEGALRTDGTFEATTLLAKCPSKYESAAKAKERS